MEGLQAVLKILGPATFLTAIILAFAAWLGYSKFSQDWQHFQSCPNTDVLSWDANLRMLQTLDVRSDFSNGNVFRALGSLFESPTWPPLHSILAQVVFLFTGPSTIVETGIGFTFAILTCALMFVIGILVVRDSGLSSWAGALLALSAVVILFHSPELTAYFLSAMLETQGMFFFLLVSFSFFKLWSVGKGARLWVLFATLGLFLTKYPYGHILLVAGAPILLMRETKSIPDLIRFLRNQYSGRSLVVPGFVAATVLTLAFAKFLPGELLNSKTFKYIFYGVVVVFFLDFNWKLWRSRTQISWPESWHVGYLYCALPILFLTFLNPDRFSSTIGTQLHNQDASRSYFLSLFTDLTDSPAPVIIWFSLLGFLLCLALVRKSREFLNVIRHPLACTLLLILTHIIVLEFLTSNKQLRHIYHLLPALILFPGLTMLELTREWKWGPALTACTLFVGTAPLFFGDRSFFKSNYYNSRYVCWTGTERILFEPVRKLVAQVDRSQSYILINRLHGNDAPVPGRQWATEFDLLLRMQSTGVVRNDSRRKKADWSEFNGVLLIQGDCADLSGNELVSERARLAGRELALANSYSSPGLCLKDFRFSKIDETR